MSRKLLTWFVGGLVVAAGCSSGGDGGTDPGPNPAIALSLSPTNATVAQGGSTPVLATLTRSGGFTGTVNLTAEGAPAGATASVGTPSTVGGTTTATVTVTVAASVAPGSYPITIRGTGSGVSPATAVFTLTVASQPGFSLSTLPTSGSLAQTQTQDIAVTITRVSYSSAITLTAENLSAGLAASFNPATTTGNTSTLTLSASATVNPGLSVATIRGTGPDPSGPAIRAGGSAPPALVGSTSLQISVAAANINVDFSACAVEFRPLWGAVQDGTGAWRRVATVAPNVYRMHVSQSKGGIAFVVPGQFFFALRQSQALRAGNRRQGTLLRAGDGKRNAAGDGFDTYVQYGSRDELIALAGDQCPPEEVTKTVNGSVTGVGPSEYTFFSMGASVDSRGGDGVFQLRTVHSGLQDFFAYTMPSAAPAFFDRMVIRRDQNIADNATMPQVNMTTESFPAEFDLLTVSNHGTDNLAQSMNFFSTNQCWAATLYADAPVAGNPFYAYGVPDARLRANDFHQAIVHARNADFSSQRYLYQSFHFLGPATPMRIPDPVPVPVITTPPGPYKRLGASFTTPGDYLGTAQSPYLYLFLYFEDEGAVRGDGGMRSALRLRDRALEVAPFNGVVIQATQTWFGGLPAAVVMPDYSAMSEWNNAWGPSNALPGFWLVELFQTTSGSACVEGAQQKLGFRAGLY